MQRKISVIMFSGIWIYPVSFGMMWLLYSSIYSSFHRGQAMPVNTIITIAAFALIPVGLVFIYNMYLLLTGMKTDFTFFGYFKKSKLSPKKVRAMYPAIDPKYLSNRPEGMILGKYKNHYVRIPIDPFQVYHTLIVGPPGSGKSSGPLLCSLLANYIFDEPYAAVFCLDIKPELAKEATKTKGNPYVRVISPDDRSGWGWDVYYGLTGYSSEDEILARLTLISSSLITGDRSSPQFFVSSAQNIFCGMALYYFVQELSFLDTVQRIIGKEVSQHISTIITDEEYCRPDSRIYALLNRYNGISGDAWDNICMYLQGSIQSFLTSDVRYMLQDNPRKADPRNLEQKISVFLSFPEESLKHYRTVLNLITAQTLDYLQGRHHYSGNMIYLIIDEFARIGRLDGILDSLATLRSRQVSIVLAVQDLSQLRTIYSRDEALTIVNLCKALCVLDCQDLDTCRMISAMAGTYVDDNVTYSGNFINRTSRTSFGSIDKNVLDVADLQTLSSTGEAVIIIAGRYYRIRKAFYKTDPVLGPLHKEVLRYNSLHSF